MLIGATCRRCSGNVVWGLKTLVGAHTLPGSNVARRITVDHPRPEDRSPPLEYRLGNLSKL